MSSTVKIGEAKTHLSELIARVEKGEEIVISRGDEPVAKLVRIDRKADVKAAVAAIKALRARVKPIAVREILDWKDQGRRF